MRAIAACQFTLHSFTVWRVFVLLLATGAVVVMVGWSAAQPGTWDWPLVAIMPIVIGVALGFGARLAKVDAADLRWDGQNWFLAPTLPAGREPVAGTLAVVIDLGSWMLLRFRAELPTGGFAATWLPVQRRGLEPRWHALRCAVYSPRPAVDAADT